MSIQSMRVAAYIPVTVLMFLSLSSCAKLVTPADEEPVRLKKPVFAERQRPSDFDTFEPPPTKRDVSITGDLNISIEEAVLLALDNNRAFQVERLRPEILRTNEMEERAAFDPTVSAEYSILRESIASGETPVSKTRQTAAKVEISEFLPTGTDLEVEISTDVTEPHTSVDERSTRGGISITQALLRGYGLNVNLASLEQARLDTIISEYELRGFAESLVAEVEQTCWDYILAERRIAIFKDSLKLAEDQLLETRERIKVGKLAEVELYAAQAEVAFRREALINAKSNLALTRLRLQSLLGQPGSDQWAHEIAITDKPVVPDVKLDEVAEHVQVALRWRPEVNQTRLGIKRGDLEIVKTKNGLLPVVDLFITMGKTGYADSFSGSINDFDGESYDILGGVILEYPIYKRADSARHRRATLSRQQTEEAYFNLLQLVEVDVRSAMIEVNRAREQVTATAATRKLQEESLKAETEKFRVGKSTALLVARAQRDLLLSQITEIEAVITNLKALVEFYRLEGSLLERRGITAPGRESIDLALDGKE